MSMDEHITDSDYYPLPGGSTMQQTFKYWIYAKISESGRIRYELSDLEWAGETSLQSRVLISAHTITHELPDIAEVTPAIVEKLQAKKQAMQATAAAAIAQVDGQIQSLLAIGHEVAA